MKLTNKLDHLEIKLYASIIMDKKEALKIVQENGSELSNLPDHFKKDKQIVLEAVKQDGWYLEFADKNFKKDKKFILFLKFLKKVRKS